jgi:hypothetical protein
MFGTDRNAAESYNVIESASQHGSSRVPTQRHISRSWRSQRKYLRGAIPANVLHTVACPVKYPLRAVSLGSTIFA